MLKKVIKAAAAWTAYTVVSLVLPPMFKRAEGENTKMPQAEGTGERILCIDDNTDALIYRLGLIEAAKERLVLTTFDFRDDESGGEIMAALYDAAERGVKIKILLDGMNAFLHLRKSDNFNTLAAHENITVKLYNPVNLLLPYRINYRMHDKYLIADDFAYILGGRNTDDLFLGHYVEKYNEDRDILVFEEERGGGSSYNQLTEYFKRIWNLKACKIYIRAPKKTVDFKALREKTRERYPQAFENIDWRDTTESAESVRLITNPIEAENKSPSVWKIMVSMMRGGEEVLIQSPYVICSKDMYGDLTEVCARSKNAQLIINAVESGTNPFGCTDYLSQKKKIIDTNLTVYEYLGAQAQHTKTVLIGDDLSIVGSCNVDMRSVYLDTELMLVIKSRPLNAELKKKAELLKKSSRRTLPDGSESEGESFKSIVPGRKKKIIYFVLRRAIKPVRHLL